MQVGKTKDQGLYNKPSVAVHPGALAAGTLPQYNTIQYNCFCDTLRVLELYPLPTLKCNEPTDHLLNTASSFADFLTKEWTDVCMVVKVNHYVYV